MTAATLLIGLANWTEVCLAMNRVLAICLPHQYSKLSSRRVVLGMLLATWLMVGFIGPDGAYPWGGQFMVIFINQCVFVSYGRLGDFFVSMVMFVPMGLTGTCCAIILAKSALVQRQQRRAVVVIAAAPAVAAVATGSRRPGGHSPHTQRRLEIAVLLFTSFLWGAACDTPWTVMVQTSYSHLFIEYPILAVWVHFIIDAQYSISPVSCVTRFLLWQRVGLPHQPITEAAVCSATCRCHRLFSLRSQC